MGPNGNATIYQKRYLYMDIITDNERMNDRSNGQMNK